MSTSESLRSKKYDLLDAFAANEFYQAKGWTDGLPIVPPTEERVSECLDVAGLAPGDIIGIERVRQRPMTAEKVAINAVLAGCLPAYMPVVVAVLGAMCDEKYNLHGTSASTGGAAPFIVVNGPVRTLIGMNATHNVLANGNRPNATIGRTIRLALINLLGVIPGEMDRSTLGHPGKFTFCIAEDEEDSPWTPLAQERDIPEGESASGRDPRDVRGGNAPQHADVLHLGWKLLSSHTKTASGVAGRSRLAEARHSGIHIPFGACSPRRLGESRQDEHR